MIKSIGGKVWFYRFGFKTSGKNNGMCQFFYTDNGLLTAMSNEEFGQWWS